MSESCSEVGLTHVSSYDSEGLLLDITVCHPCRVAAEALGLKNYHKSISISLMVSERLNEISEQNFLPLSNVDISFYNSGATVE